MVNFLMHRKEVHMLDQRECAAYLANCVTSPDPILSLIKDQVFKSLPKFLCWNSNSQCDGNGRRDL